MLNRIFLSLASIGTSLVLAYAHLSQWWIRGDESHSPNPTPVDNIHFYTGEMVLSPNALLGFGVLFLFVGISSLVCSILSKWKGVFLCFVVAMILIWIRISAGIR
jgi:hypothetical protein